MLRSHKRETGGTARLVAAARSTDKPPGVLQDPLPVHPIGLGSGGDVADNYWQAQPSMVVVPRGILVRLREAHLWQLNELRRLHSESAEARKWDLRYGDVLRNLERARAELFAVTEDGHHAVEEVNKAAELKGNIKRDIESLKRELQNLDKISPGLAKRVAQDAEWRRALAVGHREKFNEDVQKRHIRLRPMRQVFARRHGDPLEPSDAPPDPWTRTGAHDKDLFSSFPDIDAARQDLNSIVARLNSKEPLAAAGLPSETDSSKPNNFGDALQVVQDIDELQRKSLVEARTLRLELQAARGGERAARAETQRVREAFRSELREVQHAADAKASAKAAEDARRRDDQDEQVQKDKVVALKAKFQEQEQTIKSLMRQLAEKQKSWADDVDELHRAYASHTASMKRQPRQFGQFRPLEKKIFGPLSESRDGLVATLESAKNLLSGSS